MIWNLSIIVMTLLENFLDCWTCFRGLIKSKLRTLIWTRVWTYILTEKLVIIKHYKSHCQSYWRNGRISRIVIIMTTTMIMMMSGCSKHLKLERSSLIYWLHRAWYLCGYCFLLSSHKRNTFIEKHLYGNFIAVNPREWYPTTWKFDILMVLDPPEENYLGGGAVRHAALCKINHFRGMLVS